MKLLHLQAMIQLNIVRSPLFFKGGGGGGGGGGGIFVYTPRGGGGGGGGAGGGVNFDYHPRRGGNLKNFKKRVEVWCRGRSS